MATRRFLKPYILPRHDRTSGLTHQLLDGHMGGRVRIPDDKMDEFLIAYATDVKDGQPNYVNELRRSYFRMFLDLDIEWTTQLTNVDIEQLMAVVYKTFQRFFPNNNTCANRYMCIISDAVPKSLCVDLRSLRILLNNKAQIEDLIDASLLDIVNSGAETAIAVEDMKDRPWDCDYNTIFKINDGRMFRNTHRKNGLLKHGIHMNFPFIIVSSDPEKGGEALYMREALIDAFTKEFGTKFAPNGWATVIDNAVYVSSGMRMMYSGKTSPCDLCKGKGKDNEGKECYNCENGKDLSERRPYKFRFACNDGKYDQSMTETLRNNLVKLLSFSILYTSQCQVSDGWKKFNGCPSFGDIKKTKSNGPPKLESRERIFQEDKKTMKTWKNKIPVNDPYVHEICEKTIRTRFVKEYKNIRIRSIVRDDKRIYIAVDGEGSNFCLNLNPPRDHNSNRIWFSAEQDGIRVRCFCSCLKTEGRFLGYCKDFKSSAKAFSAKDLAILFPSKNTSITKISSNPMFNNASAFLKNMHEDLFEEQLTKKQKN